MNRDQWSRVKDVFNAALERDARDRRGYVAGATADDEVVRHEVERLLDAQGDSAAFIEHPAAATLLTGRTISHYEVGRLLGSGGMGYVYAARDTELGREVALKVPSFDGDDAQARLRREAQHASRLSHPHVCHIYEVGRDNGRLFVVMELVPGRSLAELLKEGPLSIADARRYGMEIADALAHAHEHGVNHRDLKSTNVIITPKRGAKVLDFGLARMLDTHQIDALSHSQRSLTDEGLIAGTLPYMAPELLRGQRGDQRTDIWALGVLLYEMVTGQRPFTGSTGFEVSAGILHQDPAPLPAHVPEWMRAAIQGCLEKDPANRYQHASDAHVALEAMKGTVAATQAVVSDPPRATGRRILGLPRYVVFIALAAIAWYGIRTASESRVFGNVRGYSLLESGDVEEALSEFQGAADRSRNDPNTWDSLGEGFLAAGRPDRSLEAYSRALAIDASFTASRLGRSVALAALGRYDEALADQPRDFRMHAYFQSRVGRYREAAKVLEDGRREDDGAEAQGNAWLTSAWLLIEQQQYARALEDVAAAKKALADRTGHSLLVLADLIAGIAEIRAGQVDSAAARLASLKPSIVGDDRVEANWVASLEGEVALAQGRVDVAEARFKAAQQKGWHPLGRDASTVFAFSLPSRDGLARIAIARGQRAAAIDEYRRLTATGQNRGSSAALEPRYVLALARLLLEQGDIKGAHAEYARFLKLWARADPDLPELIEAKQNGG